MKKIYFLLIFVLSISLLFGREVSVKIVDNDLEIPLEGAKIQIETNNVFNYTDPKGYAKIMVDDKDKNVILTITLTGYNPKRYMLKDNESNTLIKMTIVDVIEGRELVVEKDKIGQKDEELGISTVIDESQLNSTAKIGMIEDVMSTIKMLPGVSYGGNFNAKLSVRGGRPDELTCLYDGFLIKYPYQWGGAYSIFNPNITESAKFSTGIFNVKNGQAISGLLEVNTVNPNEGLKFYSKLASNTVELLIQVPIGKTSGFFAGTRLVFTNLILAISDQIIKNNPSLSTGFSFPTAPYINQCYMKWYWKPNDRFEWFVDGFFTGDGIGVNVDGSMVPNSNSDIKSVMDFFYYNYDAVGFTGFKILPTDKIFINFLAGYEYLCNGLNYKQVDSGEKKYSNDFVNYINNLHTMDPVKFPDTLNYGDKYKLDDLTSNFTRETAIHSIQSRLDVDFTLHEKVMLSVGLGATYDITVNSNKGNVYSINGFEYKRIKFEASKENKQALKSFVYLDFVFNILPETLKIDVGCRADHVIYYILDLNETFNYNSYHFTTYPIPEPRFNITYTPIKNLSWLEKFSISTGVGIFSKIPLDEIGLTKEIGLKDFEVNMPRALSTVAGVNFEFPLGFNFKLEGYYKYYYDNLYINYKNKPNGRNYYVHSDGIGHVAGFDLMLERKISRYIDGWISYTFIYAGYKNPQSDGLDKSDMSASDPRGIWYYPDFQRFHTLNIVLNIRPLSWFTITTSFTFATGSPRVDYTGKVMFPAKLEDGTNVEMYSRRAVYSTLLRTNVSFPLNIKFTFNAYLGKSNVKFEAYFAIEDIFAPIAAYLMPYDNIQTNQYTGEDQKTSSGNFNMPFPQPSAGISFSF